MAQTVLIVLTTAGTNTGPFSLYSNVDGFVTPFELGVSKAALEAGYTSFLVPDGATIIRVKSNGVCTNYIDIPFGITTTTTTSSSTTTTTSTTISTTSTTTTTYCQSIGAGAGCFNWNFTAGGTGAIVQWTDCNGNNQTSVLNEGESGSGCLCDGQTPNVLEGSLSIISQVGTCP